MSLEKVFNRPGERQPHFSQPIRQVTLMLIALALVGVGLWVARDEIAGIFFANLYLNGAIFALFVLGVLSTFSQVWQLIKSIQWIEGFASERVGAGMIAAPSLLAPLATLMRSRGARSQISSGSSRSILETVAQRIDEDREITRYIGNTLIFLGLLGTFYGLATTVPALVETIRSLAPGEGESGAAVFSRLQAGLEAQLGGMGTAFSSSLLGLAGSLIVGLLELFASHGQNRFYRELEEWLSTITRVGFSSEESSSEEVSVMASYVDHLAEQMETLQRNLSASETRRANLNEQLAEAIRGLSSQSSDVAAGTTEQLSELIFGQRELLAKFEDGGGGGDGLDAESRMRLRSIDVQMLRLLEEISAGRQESTASLRNDIAELTRAIERATAR